MGLFIFLTALLLLAWVLYKSDDTPMTHSQPNVTTNSVTIPNDIVCPHCQNKEHNIRRDLDSSTFDIICFKCKGVAWENPDRQDRIDMLDYLFEQTSEYKDSQKKDKK
jgi:hypothetical protein